MVWALLHILYQAANEFNGIRIYDINEPEPQSRLMLKGTIEGKTPDIETWEPFDREHIKEGHYYVEHTALVPRSPARRFVKSL